MFDKYTTVVINIKNCHKTSNSPKGFITHYPLILVIPITTIERITTWDRMKNLFSYFF